MSNQILYQNCQPQIHILVMSISIVLIFVKSLLLVLSFSSVTILNSQTQEQMLKCPLTFKKVYLELMPIEIDWIELFMVVLWQWWGR
jgi:hypothetical protein